MKTAYEIDNATRAERLRWRRARYRRRLMFATVLAGLLIATGAFAATIREGGSSEADLPAVKAGEVRPPSAVPEGAQPSTAHSAEEARVPATETTEGPPAAGSGWPTHEPADEGAPGKAQKDTEESLDVLLLGVDRRPSDAEGSTSHSDSMMLVRVSPQTGRIQSLSVPRDLLVEVEPGVEDRINTAYLYGGTQRATAVMEDLTGINIDRHAIVDFGGFEDVIDALGGVTLKVKHPIRIGIDGRRVHIPPGRQELDGLEALAYARYRGTACGDLDRIRRQQRLVGALREQALGWNTITKLPAIVKVMHENVGTDLGILQAISLGRALVGQGKSAGMRSYQLKGKPEILANGEAVLVPNEQVNERILENFRNDGPTKNSKHEQAPRDDGSSSEC
jgi:LCP family protein required for cell wall assembly